MKNKIIFLDIDGPLLPQKMHYFGKNRNLNKFDENYQTPVFDPWGVRALNLWARYSKAQIVLCTHWLKTWDINTVKEIMQLNGLGLDYHIDCVTPKKMSSYKCNEIVWWLRDHPECENFIVVEDDHSCEQIEKMTRDLPVSGKWIKVDYANGISIENFHDGCVQLNIDHELLMFEEFGVPILSPKEKEARNTLLRSLI